MKKNKMTLSNENIIIESSVFNLYKEKNNDLYYFESFHKNLNHFLSIDYLESVSALMKLKELHDFDLLWDIEITDEMRNNIDIKKSLYWLSGGDREWITSKIYNTTWSDSSHLFLEEFEEMIEDINKKCNTLGETRDEFIKYMNLPTLYEFGLKKGIIV